MKIELSVHLLKKLRSLQSQCTTDIANTQDAGTLSFEEAVEILREPSGTRYFIDLARVAPAGRLAITSQLLREDGWKAYRTGREIGRSDGNAKPPADAFREIAALLPRATSKFRIQCELAGISFRDVCHSNIIEQFLAPYRITEEMEDDGSETSIIVSRDRNLFERAEELWRQSEHLAWSSARDHPGVAARGDGYSFYRIRGAGLIGRYRYPKLNESFPLLFLKPVDRPWHVLTETDDEDADRSIARVLRAIMSYELERSGAVPIHAAAFSINNRGYLLCGRKGTGKTTNLIGSLRFVNNVSFVSNDRTFLRWSREAQKIVLQGTPQSVPVRIETLAMDTSLRAHLEQNGFPGRTRGYSFGLDLSNRRLEQTPEWFSEGEAYFAPSELVSIFNRTITPTAHLSGVIIIEKAPPLDGTPWVPMDPAIGLMQLRREQHPLYDGANPFWNELFPAVRQDPEIWTAIHRHVKFWTLRSFGDLQNAWRGFAAIVEGQSSHG